MPERPVCLVLMPMYAGFEEVRAQVANAVAVAGFEMCRLEVEIADSAWHLWLLDAVERADAVLVDLTDHNPFVMYELGYTHRRQLPTTFIVNGRTARVPATVRGAVCIPYGDGCETFERGVIDELQQASGSPASIPAAPDRAITSAESHDLYVTARARADDMRHATGGALLPVDEREFHARVQVALRRGAPDPRQLPPRAAIRALLSLVVEESDRVPVMRAIVEWSFARQVVQA